MRARSVASTYTEIRASSSLLIPDSKNAAQSQNTQQYLHAPIRAHGLNALCPAEKGIKLVQEGQYAQAVSMFTEAIKCDPKDYRWVFSKTINSLLKQFSHFLFLHPIDSLGTVPIVITAWSFTLRLWQTLSDPSSWLQTGPKVISAKAVLLWAWRWVQGAGVARKPVKCLVKLQLVRYSTTVKQRKPWSRSWSWTKTARKPKTTFLTANFCSLW